MKQEPSAVRPGWVSLGQRNQDKPLEEKLRALIREAVDVDVRA